MNNPKILLLTDDPSLYGKVQRSFFSSRYEIVIPTSPTEALAWVSDPDVRVAIVDTAFYRMDLSVFLPRLKTHNSKVRIVVIATVHSESIERAARWEGVLYYATRPFNARTLRKIVHRFMTGHHCAVAERTCIHQHANAGL